MYTKQPKKMLIMNILDILRRYTDENHRLSQREIISILQKEYGMKAERKAVKRNLLNLIEFGYDIEYSESIRKNNRGEEEIVFTDWYMVHSFSDSELRLLIDSVLFSKHMPNSQCKKLIEKLEGLSNIYFRSRVGHIHVLSNGNPENQQLFYTIDILDEAMTKGKKVFFYYNEYGTDKQMHRKKNRQGDPQEYIVNPYQMTAVNGRYYLIGNYDKYNNLSNYRVDRITDIRMLDIPVKSVKKIKGMENGLDLSGYVRKHIYMYSTESAPVTFSAKKYLVSDLIDWFGKEICFLSESQDEVIARVTVDLEAMRKWALQYALHVKVLKPEKLVEAVKEDIRKAGEIYC